MKEGFFNVILPHKEEDAVGILLYGYIGTEEKVDSAAVVAEIRELGARYRNIDVRINSTHRQFRIVPYSSRNYKPLPV